MILSKATQDHSSKIENILLDHRPPLESEIQDYVKSLLEDALSEENNVSNRETLRSTLEQFLAKDECESIHALLTTSSLNCPADYGNIHRLPSRCIPPLATLSAKSLAGAPTFSTSRRTRTPESSEESNSSSSPMSKKDLRKERRLKKSQQENKTSPLGADSQETSGTALDDHASAWQECQETGQLWGGRGHGGRGIRNTGENLHSIHLPSVSLQFAGNELLVNSPMDIVQGHCYGLLGRNGVGKSTLLTQLANHAIPGMPRSMRILLVQQQIHGRDDETALETLVMADQDRLQLLQEQDQVEADMEASVGDMEANAERLGEIITELDAMDADDAEDRALEILKGLSFTPGMINGPTSNLSGGFRMRLALAQALYIPRSDLILLDECTNHLDLHGMAWLVEYLIMQRTAKAKRPQQQPRTLMVVSHDRTFLDSICTDIVVMEHQRLTYHPGDYSNYRVQKEEKAARDSQILDASERQRSKALAFVQRQQQQANKKSADPNKQRQAKMIKDKKLDRIGNYRDDGKRFKLNSLKKLDERSMRLAQKVQIERDEPVVRLRFPNPTWPPSVSEGTALIRLSNVSFGYDSKEPPLLHNMTLQLARGGKVALVGKNGCGKSTLVRLLAGEVDTEASELIGEVWRHPSIRIGHVTQYSIEELGEFENMTVVEYAESKLAYGRASSSLIKKASGNIRQYLGSFGLGGSHAHRQIGKLSGGERMRLCFATVLADQPHVLFLDESTNHVDLETLDSMAVALREFKGAVLMVSHNQAFLSGFCKELWTVENGSVNVQHDDTLSFDELFSEYRSHVLSSKAASSRLHERKIRTHMAKRAIKQNATAKQNTTLFA